MMAAAICSHQDPHALEMRRKIAATMHLQPTVAHVYAHDSRAPLDRGIIPCPVLQLFAKAEAEARRGRLQLAIVNEVLLPRFLWQGQCTHFAMGAVSGNSWDRCLPACPFSFRVPLGLLARQSVKFCLSLQGLSNAYPSSLSRACCCRLHAKRRFTRLRRADQSACHLFCLLLHRELQRLPPRKPELASIELISAVQMGHARLGEAIPGCQECAVLRVTCLHAFRPDICQLGLPQLILDETTTGNETAGAEDKAPVVGNLAYVRGVVPLDQWQHLQSTRIRFKGLDAYTILGQNVVLMSHRCGSRKPYILEPSWVGFHR
mmetsp:Transcript_31697/g.80028  ORF Transcript_31697/g.80028 Transcript_31697/m.80028 type:complete len:319 (+) Transcript_31697:679-1635(+)